MHLEKARSAPQIKLPAQPIGILSIASPASQKLDSNFRLSDPSIHHHHQMEPQTREPSQKTKRRNEEK
ncbi:uncharacterized protein K452DRAFT_291252 [Aplosporella prunicola CBS 121167]|uniref:Uncharacterized protein n=1 Tax=Aplosporella prunicola CBS 121167 TaxID=1176127 RepID=A0A6A6B159_9PEZI|nr:uncharacterized protein K452DRAFT_291252 [Aplosporella prunicola CBS 121167]KAF2137899.1 hypothetical protein K452DRAFT_291252 [Aplosporella prunicola CBS 121167]